MTAAITPSYKHAFFSNIWDDDGFRKIIYRTNFVLVQIGALEGQLYKAQDRLVKLSEQQLVDCADEHYGNFGCRGGSPANAFDYAVEFGIETARKYSYINQQKQCE